MAGGPFGGQTGFGSGLTVTPAPPGFTPQNTGQQITDPQTGRTFTLGQDTFDQAFDTGPAYNRAMEAFNQSNQQQPVMPRRGGVGEESIDMEAMLRAQQQHTPQQRNPFMGGGYGMPFGGMPFYGGMMQPSPFYGGLGGLFGGGFGGGPMYGGFGGGPMYGGFGQRFNPYQSMMPQSQGYTPMMGSGMSPYQSMMPQQREYTPMMRSSMSPYGIGSLFRRG